MLIPERIIIHHSLTEDGETLSWPAIHRYHVNHNGWSDIGYHAGIEEVEGRYVCVFGRPDVLSGAHTLGENSRSFGFCFVGNYDLVEPEPARLRVACRRVLAPWLFRYGLGPADLVPHRDYALKTCPGSKFDMDLLREIAQEELDVLQRS
jgi:N-acetylmuramoyl-L-alanine amidase